MAPSGYLHAPSLGPLALACAVRYSRPNNPGLVSHSLGTRRETQRQVADLHERETSAVNMYPPDRTVMINWGSCASRSIFWRSPLTSTSMLRSNGATARPRSNERPSVSDIVFGISVILVGDGLLRIAIYFDDILNQS